MSQSHPAGESNNCPIDLSRLQQLQERPEPFAPGHPLFWDDPHISKQMLAVHLDPDNSAASRPSAVIDTSVAWLMEILALLPGDHLLDLGCGPGLYAARFAAQGVQITGVDYSRNSIDYATRYAREHGLPITYRHQNYLTLEDADAYHAALLIYGDFCVLAPDQRRRLLGNIHRALVDGGRFVLDVSTRMHRQRYGTKNGWYVAESGFWRPGPHLVLEQGFDYPDESIYCDQYAVVDPDGNFTVYRNWFQDYTPSTIRAEMEANGFVVEGMWDDLAGSPLTEDGEWIGIVTRKS